GDDARQIELLRERRQQLAGETDALLADEEFCGATGVHRLVASLARRDLDAEGNTELLHGSERVAETTLERDLSWLFLHGVTDEECREVTRLGWNAGVQCVEDIHARSGVTHRQCPDAVAAVRLRKEHRTSLEDREIGEAPREIAPRHLDQTRDE